MDETLKVTSVLSDPTRFHIYQYLLENHKEVNVNDIAKKFNIHPNVARLHLSKLEDIDIINSYTQKSGKGGRPSRVYYLSNNVIELNFPHRDYKLLSSILIDSLASMGAIGKKTLYSTGKSYGMKIMEDYQLENLSNEKKLHILEDASTMLGLYSKFQYDEKDKKIKLEINNCPFKELASNNPDLICDMHYSFIEGMLEALFTDVHLITEDNMLEHNCESCSYIANIKGKH